MERKAEVFFENGLVKKNLFPVTFVIEKSPSELKNWEKKTVKRILKNGDVVVFLYQNPQSDFFLEGGIEGFVLPEKKKNLTN